ncbi:MAG: type II toxin-antitoxin system RelE/ParE family toxin [Opitutales bacterium]|nr:type II toxin-antitoxin system RelE/ParE family toxin [Opitutales bacterium]
MSSWAVKFDERAAKELRKQDRQVQTLILRYLKERIATSDDPRRFGKALQHDKAGLWRYRVGDYRIICEIRDGELVVLVIAVGHRREIYE